MKRRRKVRHRDVIIENYCKRIRLENGEFDEEKSLYLRANDMLSLTKMGVG